MNYNEIYDDGCDDMPEINEKLIKASRKECLYYKILCDKLSKEIYDDALILRLIAETHDDVYGKQSVKNKI